MQHHTKTDKQSETGSTIHDHPWLAHLIDEKEYLPPSYYAKLLKPYRAGGRNDLEIFGEFLSSLAPIPARALELGCGSGRATSVALRLLPTVELTAVDLSSSMLSAMPLDGRLRTLCSDICAYLLSAKCEAPYELIFSLWAFSHSVHMWLGRARTDPTVFDTAARAVRTMLTDRISPGGRFFIMHFDSLSEEQRVAMPQWAKVDAIFSDVESQSPSFRLIASIIEDLNRRGRVEAGVTHFQGEAIEYDGIEQALETYFNFHLEGRLNRAPAAELEKAVSEVTSALERHQDRSGRIVVVPSWFVFSGTRVE
ncbi:MAG: class I SAM-dependent methyltransferase [Acidobacteria bacterium]|nr:class I SAM-dependent methyltransferase [Acidobacteriota bacterium]